MPYYNFKCEDCSHVETKHIYQEDDLTWREQVFVSGLSEQEIEKLKDWEDPRDFEVYNEVNYGKELPDEVKCQKCNNRALFYVKDAPLIKNGRNSYQAMKERRRYAIEGMDKKQAEQFYQESIQASKERIAKGGDSHYKKIVPNFEVLAKEGKVKKLNDEQRARKIENLKSANIHLTKDGTIGKGPRRKR